MQATRICDPPLPHRLLPSPGAGLSFLRRRRPCAQALLRGSLRKAFGGFDLWMLGLGLVVASGWASLTGQAGQLYAG